MNVSLYIKGVRVKYNHAVEQIEKCCVNIQNEENVNLVKSVYSMIMMAQNCALFIQERGK
jgi:hypothetical protein